MTAWQWLLHQSCPTRIVIILVGVIVLGNVFGCEAEETTGQGGADNAPSGGQVAPEEPEQAQAEQPAEPGPEPKPQPAPPKKPRAAPIGQPLNVGDVRWIVTSARQRDRLEQKDFGQFGDTKQGNFVVVNFEFTNNSNEPVTLDSISLTLIDKRGRESNPDPDTFGYVPSDLDPFLEQVNPGVTKKGRVIFTVAPNASKFKLRLGDAAFFGDEEGFVRLGF
jgi:hypothetical protein